MKKIKNVSRTHSIWEDNGVYRIKEGKTLLEGKFNSVQDCEDHLSDSTTDIAPMDMGSIKLIKT
jgi:hypothetical protein